MATTSQAKTQCVIENSDLLIACAALLARGRHFAAAEDLLGDLREEPRALDLLARIHVQNNRPENARQCWEHVLSLSPGNRDATLAMGALSRRRHSLPFVPLVYLFAPLSVVLFITVVFALGVLWDAHRDHRTQSVVVASPTPGRAPNPETPRVITFPTPVFISGTQLSSQGRDRLVQAAEELRASAFDRVEVVGRADNVPLRNGSAFQSNRELAIARAAVAAHRLELGGVDRARIYLRYEVAALNGSASRQNWRTVLILVIAAEARK